VDAKIATALLGLAGVLIGGAITAGANYILAVRKERADEKKDTRTHQAEIRKALRLVIRELTVAVAHVQRTIETKVWFDQPLSQRAWDTYAPVLAPDLPIKCWDAVMKAYYYFDTLNRLAPTAITQLSSEVAGMLITIHEHIKAGAEALTEYESDVAVVRDDPAKRGRAGLRTLLRLLTMRPFTTRKS